MSYRLETHPAVREDTNRARRSFEQLREDLGDELAADIDQTITRLQEQPLLYQKRYGEVRFAMTERFHHKIVYEVFGDLVYVFAVLHPRQHPMSWVSRL